MLFQCFVGRNVTETSHKLLFSHRRTFLNRGVKMRKREDITAGPQSSAEVNIDKIDATAAPPPSPAVVKDNIVTVPNLLCLSR